MAKRRNSHDTTRLTRSRALRLVPASGVLDELVSAVSAGRQTAVHLLSADLGPESPTGMWIATDQGDYVVFPTDASSAEREAVICHELAHMLLGHQPEARTGRLAQLATTVAPNVDLDVALRFLHRHGYTDQLEAEAESLATALVTQLARNAEASALRRDALSDRLR